MQSSFTTDRSTDLGALSKTNPGVEVFVPPTTRDVLSGNKVFSANHLLINLYSMHLQMSILSSGTPIHCRYVGALSGSREKLIELHGKWCYTLTEKALAEYGMITLCAQADIYRQRMDYFLDQKMDVNGNTEDRADREALFDAEWVFAEQCFLELSRQATAFELRLNMINEALELLSFECDQLYRQIDGEIQAGWLPQGVPKGESSNT